MSLWTHVNGSIRIDDMSLEEKGLGYRTTLETLFGSLPTGSEGPLRVDIVATHVCGSTSQPDGTWKDTHYNWVVTITGDLRDYGHTKKEINDIIKWVKQATKNLWIRSGIVEIEVESQKPFLLHYDTGKSSLWIIKK
jgi:hypothetical protein